MPPTRTPAPRSAARAPADLAYKRAQRYAVDLTPDQVAVFELWRSGARGFWNEAVRSQNDRWRAHAGVESRNGLAYAVSAARQAGWSFPHHGTEHPATDVPAKVLHGAQGPQGNGSDRPTLAELASGWTRHLKAAKNMQRSRPPGFRSTHHGGSIRWQVQDGPAPAPLKRVITETTPGRATMATLAGLGPVKVRYHRRLPLDALIGNLILGVDDLGKHWAVVQYETTQVRQPAPSGLVGVDRGVVVTAATSDGDVYDAPGLPPGQQQRKDRLQRAMARKRRLNPCKHDTWVMRGRHPKLLSGHCPPLAQTDADCSCWKHSHRYQEDKHAFLKLTRHTQRQRTDGAHKASRALADRYATVAMEDLDTSAMTRSARGTEEDPGTNVAQKTGLNRGILASDWYQLATYVAYKTRLVTVPAHHTSLTCPECGLVSTANRPTRDTFLCVGCGFAGHADIVGAINIEARGKAEKIETPPGAKTAVAQTVEAQSPSEVPAPGMDKAERSETSEPTRAEPANAHHSEQSSVIKPTLDRSHPAQQPCPAVPRGHLVPASWGIAPTARLPRRTRRPRPSKMTSPRNAGQDPMTDAT